ncbi:MAG: hypothetical protein H6686_09200 [Fibrobacteria bacterium]|nr:hypothetical protein [Fibrobacteria bacterium]
MLQDDYYVLERKSSEVHPLFCWGESNLPFGRGVSVRTERPVELKLARPIPDPFQWTDFHSLPAGVFSPHAYRILSPLDLYGVDWIEAVVRHPIDPAVEPRTYWMMHLWNRLPVVTPR